MSPIENESVVMNFMKRFEGKVELVDCSDKLKGIVYRKGMDNWKMLIENAKEKGKFIEV